MSGSDCRRCLLSEMNHEEYQNGLYEYIKNLGEDNRAPQELYKTRLAICKECDELINGMCKLCGAFVEYRAVKKSSYCAKDSSIW